MSDEGTGLLEGHAGPLTVGFKIENQEGLSVGLHDIQEVLGLLDAVAAGTKMIGTPEQAVGKGAGSMRQIGGVGVVEPLGSFVDDA
jgi:hypothetical protein